MLIVLGMFNIIINQYSYAWIDIDNVCCCYSFLFNHINIDDIIYPFSYIDIAGINLFI